jgi:WD40 repeat protein
LGAEERDDKGEDMADDFKYDVFLSHSSKDKYIARDVAERLKDDRYALSGSSDKTVRLWDIESGRCIRVLEGHSDRVEGVAFSGDSGRALSGSTDKTMRLWDVESGHCLRVLEGHSDIVLSLAFNGRKAVE